MAPIHAPLSNLKFTLNAWGVAGIFGGEEAISAMSMIPLYQGRRWLGWYNSPGSLDVARHFGNLSQQSSFWQHIFPYTPKTPAVLFGFDGGMGPKYIAALSGTEMHTGHLGHLSMERCRGMTEVTEIEGRRTLPAEVALVELQNVDYDHTVPRLSFINTLLAIFPIAVSVSTCIMCALYYDWYSFSVIAVSILASGFASIAIGSGKLSLQSVTKPAPGAPPGHGVLLPMSSEDIAVVVKGPEAAVNAITKGKFALDLVGRHLHHAVGICSLLLVVEFLVQLLLLPQGSLFGQIMFVTSLCVSWGYNFHLSSYRREKLQADILFSKLGNPTLRKFRAGTRTTMVTLLAILLFHGVDHPPHKAVRKVLHTFLANDTPVWEIWREKVILQLCDRSFAYLELDDAANDLADDQRKLLHTLLTDSKIAFAGFSKHYSDF